MSNMSQCVLVLFLFLRSFSLICPCLCRILDFLYSPGVHVLFVISLTFFSFFIDVFGIKIPHWPKEWISCTFQPPNPDKKLFGAAHTGSVAVASFGPLRVYDFPTTTQIWEGFPYPPHGKRRWLTIKPRCTYEKNKRHQYLRIKC